MTTTVGPFTVVCTAVDHAGHIATPLVPYTVIASPDSTNPTISIATPAAGAIYQRDQSVTASFTCSDEAGGSGLASCVGTIPSGSVTRHRHAGHARVHRDGYRQHGQYHHRESELQRDRSYTFGGFAQPIDPAPTVNVGKAGRTYPVKFQLFDLGVPVSDLAAVSGFTYKSTSCDAFNVDAADALGDVGERQHHAAIRRDDERVHRTTEDAEHTRLLRFVADVAHHSAVPRVLPVEVNQRSPRAHSGPRGTSVLLQVLRRAVQHDLDRRPLRRRGPNRQRAAQQADTFGDAGEPEPRPIAVSSARWRSGAKPAPLSAMVRRTFAPSCFSATCSVVACACFMTLLSASWAMR